MSEFVTKSDLEQFAKQSKIDLDVIKKDLDTFNASIIAINKTQTSSHGYYSTGDGSSYTIPIINPPPTITCQDKECTEDKYSYFKQRQFYVLSEPFSNIKIPIGTVGFDATQKNPWLLDIKPRKYISSTVIGIDENSRHYVYNKFIIKVDDKDYEIKIDTAELKEQYPENKFRFNPKLYAAYDNALPAHNVGVSVALFSYGKFKSNPDWIFVSPGLSYDATNHRRKFNI